MARIAILAVLTLVLPAWTQPVEDMLRVADNNTETADKAANEVADQRAARDMDVGRHLIGQRNYNGALNRFAVVVTQFPTSRDVEEALARLTEAYLALGIASRAQTAVAVLGRKFPNGHWSAAAHDALKSAGLEPAEDEKSWISQTFK
jgi:outer membrane protein assembly factor BamD